MESIEIFETNTICYSPIHTGCKIHFKYWQTGVWSGVLVSFAPPVSLNVSLPVVNEVVHDHAEDQDVDDRFDASVPGVDILHSPALSQLARLARKLPQIEVVPDVLAYIANGDFPKPFRHPDLYLSERRAPNHVIFTQQPTFHTHKVLRSRCDQSLIRTLDSSRYHDNKRTTHLLKCRHRLQPSSQALCSCRLPELPGLVRGIR